MKAEGSHQITSNTTTITPERRLIGPVLFSYTAALVQLVRVKESMFVSF